MLGEARVRQASGGAVWNGCADEGVIFGVAGSQVL